MNCRIQILQPVPLSLISPNHNPFKTLKFPHLPPTHDIPNHRNPKSHLFLNKTPLRPVKTIRVKAHSHSDGETKDWTSWLPRGSFAAEKILRMISTATSSPICQFIPSPPTVLHSLDPRTKLVWVLALVVLPARSNIIMRFGLVIFLGLMSMWILPKNVWMDQLARVSLLCGILFVMLGLGSDGAPSLLQPRTPPPAMMGLPSLPSSLAGYSYVLFKLGPLQLTRKGLSVASTSACLTFSIFQSASLCLATTSPEELASALRWFLLPLKTLGVPVAEVTLTLLLSLRFINIVFDEVRYVAMGIVSRRINWRQLTTMETIDILFTYVRRIFKNIFSHAEQISQAMIVRGFRGDCDGHQIYLFPRTSIGIADIVSLLCLIGVIGGAILSEYYII